ncbi:hypothetical protein V5799_033079 [Amblyomma americanum]|uniref:Uncharacterized protein n=1 Tax=Amblyomma americanum TaxID=6943 RepID=A0AAQ4DPC2_AMBAM
MAALGLWVGGGSKRLVIWKVVVWALLVGYVAMWGLQLSRMDPFLVDVRFVTNLIGILSALNVQYQMQRHSSGLAAVVRALGPRRLTAQMRSLVLVLAFVPWIAQASMTAARLCRPANVTLATPVACLQCIVVRNHIWLGAVLTSSLCLVLASKLKTLNGALFLEGPLSVRAVDGARQAYGLLCSMISVIDNALGPVALMWNANFIAETVSLCLEASASALVPMSLILVNLVLIVALWLLFSEACARLHLEALETIDTLAYKLCDQPELSLPGTLACAAARQQNLGVSCWDIAPVGRSLAVFVFATAASLSGLAVYYKDQLDVAKHYAFAE